MAIARSTLAFFGTSETAGTAIASGANSVGTEVDVLGDNASAGTLNLYAYIVSTVTAGTIDIRFNPRRLTGQAYFARTAQWSVTPTNGTQLLFLGTVQASRYATADVTNNGTGASATVSILGELFKVS